MNRRCNVLWVLWVLAVASIATHAAASSTDEVRAEAAQRIAAANREASLQPFVTRGPEVLSVTDTDSARRVAAQATARQAHALYLAEVLRAGAGRRPEPIRVFDSDSARAAAAQELREQRLQADYAYHTKLRTTGSR